MISSVKLRVFIIVFLTGLAAILLPVVQLYSQSDVDTMHKGFYTAEALDFDENGWKEYVTIYVSNNAIVTVDYNAKNASGFIKSWDTEYMRQMDLAKGTYPNKYTREYAEALVNRQDPGRVDAISGASLSHDSFQLLAVAAVKQARLGNSDVVYVDFSTESNQ